jgi:hypothetical protein
MSTKDLNVFFEPQNGELRLFRQTILHWLFTYQQTKMSSLFIAVAPLLILRNVAHITHGQVTTRLA